MQFVLLIIAVYFGWQWMDLGDCERKASKYSCSYVEEKATYHVYYWKNVQNNDPKDDEYIGLVKGLINCRFMAVSYHSRNEYYRPWNERSYICVLMKDGRAMEKHRL